MTAHSDARKGRMSETSPASSGSSSTINARRRAIILLRRTIFTEGNGGWQLNSHRGAAQRTLLLPQFQAAAAEIQDVERAATLARGDAAGQFVVHRPPMLSPHDQD